ncbi:MAG: type VI secretion system-associated protein TagF [Paraburkholderia sp.]|jgi:type VI secretion system protein ImpM|uniref:type VI secretion system-associated protein TagF n=1 Tax=Burkholderiaceae TaxID=119060 RepID=UPI0010F5383E|nr:type VI secretion system-associated protein TagF [Burkholderia sp. 4M9327F10]
MNNPVGFYGKLPGAGDFVQRQLPSVFVDIWDRHFQRAVETGRRELGAHWSTAWTQGEAWRFVLSPSVCGPSGWCGLIGPATDRLGRGFPMVLAAPCPGDAGAVLGHGAWFDSLERVYLSARNEGASVEHFAAQVASLARPPADATDLAWVWQGLDWEGEEWQLALPDDEAAGMVLAEAWREASVRRGEWCLWWTRGAARMLATRGLPRSYRSLLIALPPGVHGEPPAVAGFAGHAAAPLYDAATVTEEVAQADDGLHAARLEPPCNVVRDNVLHAHTWRGVVEADAVAMPAGRWVDDALQYLGDGNTLLLSADDGPQDPRRRAALRIRETASASAPDLTSLRLNLIALHPQLRDARHDPLEPVPEEGAALAARFETGAVRVLRIGAAAAWHWRQGQLRTLFVERAAGVGGEFDDLLFGADWLTMAGLGTAGEPDCDETRAELEEGDRLLLLATRSLARLPQQLCAEALGLATCEDARVHLAAHAGLGGAPAQWPLAVVEIRVHPHAQHCSLPGERAGALLEATRREAG